MICRLSKFRIARIEEWIGMTHQLSPTQREKKNQNHQIKTWEELQIDALTIICRLFEFRIGTMANEFH